MTFGKQFWQALGAVALGALVSTAAVGQVTTRIVVAGGSATSVKMVPGGTTSIDVRIDVRRRWSIDSPPAAPASSEPASCFRRPRPRRVAFSPSPAAALPAARLTTRRPYPDSTVLNPPSNLLDPDSNDDLGATTVFPAVAAPAANILAANLTLTASGATTLGTYTINITPGVSFAGDDVGNDYDMSTGAGFTILVGQTLAVNKTGTGTGTVTSDVGAINCGATCSDIFAGDTVTLTATPTGGSMFAGWSGGGCSGTGTCVVTVNAATTVTATFNPPCRDFATDDRQGVRHGQHCRGRLDDTHLQHQQSQC